VTVSDEVLVSYAQNGEDIVLWRALGHVRDGIYVDVGGWDPDVDSVTRLFYERGWRGVDVEPIPEFADRFRERRPSNDVVQAVITEDPAERVVLHRFGTTGLSTVDDSVAERHEQAGLEHEDIAVPARRLDDVLAGSSLVGDTIHFLKIDVEGAEENVIRSVDLSRWRPWVLVVEATEPNSTTMSHGSWEPILLEAGYTFTLFDGLSRFYVSAEHPELTGALSYPACALDEFQRVREVELSRTAAAQQQELLAAHDQASQWQEEAVHARSDADQVRAQLERDRERLARVRSQRTALRAERKQLRARTKQLRAKVKRLRARIVRISAQIELRDQAAARSVRGRVRTATRRMTRR
jgi:FkbM family methyltransferase